jgi:hypothetical protein
VVTGQAANWRQADPAVITEGSSRAKDRIGATAENFC